MISSLLLLPALLATPSLKVEGPIHEGEPVTLRLVEGDAGLAGVVITAKYRENAHVRLQHEQSIGATGPDGRVEWLPEEPGVVVLSWQDGRKNVSVNHSGVPASGLVVMILAGVLLLGGAGFFFFKMMNES